MEDGRVQRWLSTISLGLLCLVHSVSGPRSCCLFGVRDLTSCHRLTAGTELRTRLMRRLSATLVSAFQCVPNVHCQASTVLAYRPRLLHFLADTACISPFHLFHAPSPVALLCPNRFLHPCGFFHTPLYQSLVPALQLLSFACVFPLYLSCGFCFGCCVW